MKPKLRILHVEDCQADSELIRDLLAIEGIDCEIIRRDTRDEFIEALSKKDYDLIFADCTLPEFSGLHALQLARQKAPEIPFIFISGTIGEDSAIESLRGGATDYVLKDRLSRLVPAVRRALAESGEKAKNHDMEQRLRQAQRLEAVGTLAGGVAHDFNNILTIIKGHTSLLHTECERPERVREIAATIDRAAQRGSELVNQLLAFARKSDGTFTLTDLNQRVREIVLMLKQAMPRNIIFELQLEEGLAEIYADPGQVERALINLSTNARDAMPNGGKIIFATSQVDGAKLPPHSNQESDRYICLRVTDTGIGMDEATRQRIFEPFFTTKADGKGTGLGMPVVYGLMQSHNGLVEVQSQVGNGTSIFLFFPIPTKTLPHQVEGPQDSPKTVEGTETVLIVDDESDVRYFLEVFLAAQGYHVLSAMDAENAIELLQKYPDQVHLLFSDLGLPKLDGFGLSSRAKSLKPGLKTVLTSGYTDGSLETRMAEAGIDGFISKPYELGSLLVTLRTILD